MTVAFTAAKNVLYENEKRLLGKKATREFFREAQGWLARFAWVEALPSAVARDPLTVRLENAAFMHVEELDLAHVPLNEVPHIILSMGSSLKRLSLFETGINELPEEIGKLARLRTLNVSGNPLSRVPAGVGKLVRLTELKISGCLLATIPPHVLALPALVLLDASRNPIESFPADLSAITSIATLVLSGTQITAVPFEVLEVPSLTALDLTDARLQAIPEELLRSETLTSLKIDGNHTLERPPLAVAKDGRNAMLKWFKQKAIEAEEAALEAEERARREEDEEES
jgi:Leucine-rich repeat (LRR) protein